MSGQRHVDAVPVARVVTGQGGLSRFEDVEFPYRGPGDPLIMSEVFAASAISFGWTPGDCVVDFHPASRHRLVAVLEGCLEVSTGDGEKRAFRVGDLVEFADVNGQGHAIRTGDGEDVRTALIDLDDNVVHQRLALISAPTGTGVAYRRTFDGPEGKTGSERGAWRYAYQGPAGLVTDPLPLKGFQYVLAPGTLDYDWHPAPQRQIVLPFTGGMDIENGDGDRFLIKPGEIYVGEDTDGKGHITRAINNQPRFSIFAHLADDAPAIGGT